MNMKKLNPFLLGILCLLTTFTLQSAPTIAANSFVKQNYINRYHEIAIQEMYRSGIPASITLAQGIIESMWGQGNLAINSNNHFGIKCKEEWQGARYNHFDDDYDANGRKIKSCFRVYDTPYQSYRDHTEFLVNRDRYQVLFNYHSTDYVNWANGLKSCGYATDPLYAQKLIRIIEENQLYKYDLQGTQQPTENPVIPASTPVESYATTPQPSTVIEMPALTINVQVDNGEASDYLPFEVTYQNQQIEQDAVLGNPYYGEKEIAITPIPTVTYEEVFTPEPVEEDYSEDIYEDIFATSAATVATVEIAKPVIYYARSMNHLPPSPTVMKAPGYTYDNRKVRFEDWQKPVLSQPVFEVAVPEPTIHFSDRNYQDRLRKAERSVKWGNVQLR